MYVCVYCLLQEWAGLVSACPSDTLYTCACTIKERAVILCTSLQCKYAVLHDMWMYMYMYTVYMYMYIQYAVYLDTCIHVYVLYMYMYMCMKAGCE